MRGLRRVLLPQLIAITLTALMPAAAAIAGADRAAASRTPAVASPWTVVTSPNLGQDVNDLEAISAATDSDVWAVGFFRNASLVYQTLTQHFNGTSWQVVSSPNSGSSDNFLAGVAAVAPGDAWAVGRTFVGTGFRTLAEHWNGSSWSIVSTPNGALQNSQLTAVDAVSPSDVWAVGYSNTFGQFAPLAMHWNGSAWSLVSTPGVGVLLSTAALASNDVWAVGATAFDDGLTFTEHWNGTTWKVVRSANATGSNLLSGVSGIASNDVWAVGVHAEGTQTLAEHWTGRRWQIVSTPNPLPSTQGNSVLVAVTAVASNDAWAVVFTIDFTKGELFQTVTEQWNGSAWAVVSSPNPGSVSATLVGVTSLLDQAVGAIVCQHEA